MQFPLSEIVDRWTILKLKTERLPSEGTLIEIFDVFTSELEKQLDKLDENIRQKISGLIEELYIHNKSIWDLEADLRAGRMDEKKDLEEIGRRAIKIRDNNKLRLQAKNKITLLVAQKIGFDRKIHHLSE